jgi:two-component system sensor histidine kinase SenX3
VPKLAARDISRLLKEAVDAAEAPWKARVRWLEVALAGVSEGVMLVDASRNIVHSNPTAQAFVNARLSDAIVERVLWGLIEQALSGDEADETVDLWGPPKRTLTLSATPLEDGTAVVGALALIEDVSDWRRLEAVRRDFIANISHELKTPVGALILLAEALADEEDREVTRRLAGRLQSEASRLAQIVDELLDLSRIEAEEHPVRESVRVDGLVADAVERVRTKAEHRGIELDINEPGLKATIVGDYRLLVSAVQNVLENAINYSDDGDTVRVEVDTPDEEVEIQVIDQGIGIPLRDLERIFERFYRVDQARARDTGGTGLGLSIVKHICQNHGGDVSVNSREGEGSTFVLRFPAGPTVAEEDVA